MKTNKLLISIILFFILSISSITISNASNDQVKHFIMSNIQSDYGASTIMSNTVALFNKLGYNNVSNNGSGGYEITSISAVRDYIKLSGNNYAFSFWGHGEYDSNGNLQINDGNYAMTPSHMSGNWHLVMIHACRSGQTSGFADALHITGYSNRGFIGWYSKISNHGLLEWGPYFNNLAGTMSIRMAHKTAAEKCTNSTPARFYGDTSWYGWAW